MARDLATTRGKICKSSIVRRRERLEETFASQEGLSSSIRTKEREGNNVCQFGDWEKEEKI